MHWSTLPLQLRPYLEDDGDSLLGHRHVGVIFEVVDAVEQQSLEAGEQFVVLAQLERRTVNGGTLDGGADLEDDAAGVVNETEVVPAFLAEAMLNQDLDVARDDAEKIKLESFEASVRGNRWMDA